MAYLNVRERRLEAKIAYVGAALSGRATNFDKLGGGTTSGDTLALSWKPKTETTFRDCEVRVALVASRGESSAEQVIALLHDVDGVVFVADSAPTAQAKNREMAVLVREALSTQTGREVPVVVQVNKTDLADAVAPEALVASLALGDWPHVLASASHGDGVVETVERALATVLAQLQKTPAPVAGSDSQAIRANGANGAAREANPLLTALRQVLRETVVAEVDELEKRLGVRMGILTTVVEEASGVRRSLETLIEASTQSHASAAVASNAALATLRELSGAVLEQRAELRGLREQLAALGTSVANVAAKVDGHADPRPVLLEALEKATRAHSDQIASSAVQTRRSIDAVASELKASDVRGALAPIKGSIEALTTSAAEISSSLKPALALVPRLERAESTLKREMRDGVHALSKLVDATHAESVARFASVELRSTELAAALDGLVEELKKPKKSWFT